MDPSETIDSLIRSLRHPEKTVVRRAADALIARAPLTPQLASRLDRLLSSTLEEDRWPLAYVLAHIGAPSDACLEVLLKALGSDDPDIRWAAASLLSRLGKTDPRVIADLCKLRNEGTSTQRRMAIYCIRDSDENQACREALLDSLRDPDPLVRVAAVTSLKAYSPMSQAGVDLLLRRLLEDPDPRVRHGAALTLGRVGASNEVVRRALTDACRSQDPRLRKAARTALRLPEKKGPAERE